MIFKNVPFGTGRIGTGWIFSNSEQVRPEKEYCYCAEPVDDTADVTANLAQDGKLLPQPEMRPTIDVGQAATNCVWLAAL